jgi:hypothetical protein
VVMKRKTREPSVTIKNIDGNEDDVVEVAKFCSSAMRPQRPPGNRLSREAQREVKVKEGFAQVQAKATADMATANLKKAQAIQDQAALSLFTLPDDSLFSDKARKYLELRREDAMARLRLRMAMDKAAQVRELAEQKKETTADAAKIANATKIRVPPKLVETAAAPGGSNS